MWGWCMKMGGSVGGANEGGRGCVGGAQMKVGGDVWVVPK